MTAECSERWQYYLATKWTKLQLFYVHFAVQGVSLSRLLFKIEYWIHYPGLRLKTMAMQRLCFQSKKSGRVQIGRAHV